MTERTEYCLQAEIQYARLKFPANEFKFAALIEEVGELSKALIEHAFGKDTPQHVFEEAIQVAAMAIRIAEEGSAEFPYQWSYNCYKDFNVNKKP